MAPGVMNARALWFTAARTAAIRPGHVADPGPGEILVRSSVSLVSAGTEMLIYRGETTPEEVMPQMSRGSFDFPIKYGYQCVGRVEAAGQNSRHRVGDRVFTTHPHQDVHVIPDDPALVFTIPESVSDDAAAFTNLMRVAIDALHAVPALIGETVVIYGQGIVGLFCTRLARRNASHVIAVDRHPLRREAALLQGADAALSPGMAHEAIDAATGGRGADLTIDASGSPAALQSAIEATRLDGTVVAVSYYGTRPVRLSLAPEFHFRRLKIVSSQGGAKPGWDRARRSALALEIVGSLPEPGHLISHRLPFERAPEAYELLHESPEQTLGVLLQYN